MLGCWLCTAKKHPCTSLYERFDQPTQCTRPALLRAHNSDTTTPPRALVRSVNPIHPHTTAPRVTGFPSSRAFSATRSQLGPPSKSILRAPHAATTSSEFPIPSKPTGGRRPPARAPSIENSDETFSCRKTVKTSIYLWAGTLYR